MMIYQFKIASIIGILSLHMNRHPNKLIFTSISYAIYFFESVIFPKYALVDSPVLSESVMMVIPLRGGGSSPLQRSLVYRVNTRVSTHPVNLTRTESTY